MRDRLCNRCRSLIPAGLHLCPVCGRAQWTDTEPDPAAGPRVRPITAARGTGGAEPRVRTGPWDDVIGGPKEPGIVRTCTYLLGGYPGSGKSTLAFQIIAPFLRIDPRPALYLGNEQEGEELLALAERFGFDDVADRILAPSDFGDDLPIPFPGVEPCITVLDSLPGNAAIDFASQEDTLVALRTVAKRERRPAFIINHVNSAGEMAGLMQFEHVVDAVLIIGPIRERRDPWRRLEALKNRTGKTISRVLEMGDRGLFAHPDACACVICKGERGEKG